MSGVAAPARPQIEAVVARWVAAWNAHSPHLVAALYHPDAVSRDMGRDMVLMGQDQIRESIATYMDAFPDLVMTARRVGVDSDRAVLEWHTTATHAGPYSGIGATGRVGETDGCIVFTLDASGRIASQVSYWDVASLLRQLGLLPAWAADE